MQFTEIIKSQGGSTSIFTKLENTQVKKEIKEK
jgi:hypothetical protein